MNAISKEPRIRKGRKGIAPLHPWTPEQDAILPRIYTARSINDRKRLYLELGHFLRPHTNSAGYDRAQRKGWLIPIYEKQRKPWTEREEAILMRDPLAKVSTLIKRLAKAGFHRSYHAVERRRRDLLGVRLDRRETIGQYSTGQAAELLGVTPFTVRRWITKGWLTATQTESRSGGPQDVELNIKAEDLRDFIAQYTAYVNLVKVDKYAFVDLMLPGHGRKDAGDADTAGVTGESADYNALAPIPD